MGRSPHRRDRPPRRGRRGAARPCSSTARSRGARGGARRRPARTPPFGGRASPSPSAGSQRPPPDPAARGAGRTAAAGGTSGSLPSGLEDPARGPGSGDVPVAAVERIAERLCLERYDDLCDAVGDGHERLDPELRADPVEARLVVAWVLVTVHIGDAAAVGLPADLLHEVELAVVL